LGFKVKRDPKHPEGTWAKYLALYPEDRCVEIDAIDPNEIRARVGAAIRSHIDQAAWDRLKAIDAKEKKNILAKLGLAKLGLAQKSGRKRQ
jgi:hypothetical protein